MGSLVIIGAGGFIGQNLAANLQHEHDIIPIRRGDLDLTNHNMVAEFLAQHQSPIIINCYSAGGRSQVHSMDDSIVNQNLAMITNFINLSDQFDLYINIGSGAEFDIEQDITNCAESDIFARMPTASYGASKNLISRWLNARPKFTTLRLFGCFGPKDYANRLLNRYHQQHDIIIQDRYFDYFSVQDFARVVNHVINHRISARDINCVYKEKLLLSEFLMKFSIEKNLQPKFRIEPNSGYNYTGSWVNLESLGLELAGLEQGLRDWQA